MGACNACNVRGQDELNEFTCQLPDHGGSVEKPQSERQPTRKGPSTPNQGSSEAPTRCSSSDASSPCSDDDALPKPEREHQAEEQSAQTMVSECSPQPADPVPQPEEERAALDDRMAPSPPTLPQEWMVMPSVGTWYLSRQTKWIEAALMATSGDKMVEGSVQADTAAACEETQPESYLCGGVAPTTEAADSSDFNGWAAPEESKTSLVQDAIYSGSCHRSKTPWAQLPSVATWASIRYLPAFDREAIALKEVATLGVAA